MEQELPKEIRDILVKLPDNCADAYSELIELVIESGYVNDLILNTPLDNRGPLFEKLIKCMSMASDKSFKYNQTLNYKARKSVTKEEIKTFGSYLTEKWLQAFNVLINV